MIKFSPLKSQSHLLIVISIIVSLVAFQFPYFAYIFALDSDIFASGNFSLGIQQMILFQFIHGGWWHLAMNLYFLFVAGPEVEARMSKNVFFTFFLLTTVIITIGLQIFTSNTVTVGISGFCMALLAYLSADLYSLRHHRANEFWILLAVNVAIGFLPGISFFGHLIGAICGFAFWYLTKKLKFFS